MPAEVLDEQRLLLLQHRAWSTAADELEREISSRKRDDSTGADTWERERRVAKVSLLATRMHHWYSERMLEEAFQEDSCMRLYDRTAQKLIRYARSIIELTDAAEDRTEMCRSMSFSPEIGIYGILFLLAHWTTDPEC